MIVLWCILFGLTSPPVLRAEASAMKLRLTDNVEITLTIEGDSPLRVEAPNEWLLDAIPWRARLLTPPTVVELPGERSRWQARLRLTPDAPADKWLVQFRSVRVQAGQGTAQELSFTPLEIEVRSSRTSEEIRGPMDVEEAPTAENRSVTKLWYLVAGGVTLVTSLGAFVGWRRRRRGGDNGLSPVEQLNSELLSLAQCDLPDQVFAERLAQVVRWFLEGSRGLPATQRTTGELAPLLGANALADMVPVLSRCDEIRFAGQAVSATERQELLQACRDQLLETPA